MRIAHAHTEPCQGKGGKKHTHAHVHAHTHQREARVNEAGGCKEPVDGGGVESVERGRGVVRILVDELPYGRAPQPFCWHPLKAHQNDSILQVHVHPTCACASYMCVGILLIHRHVILRMRVHVGVHEHGRMHGRKRVACMSARACACAHAARTVSDCIMKSGVDR